MGLATYAIGAPAVAGFRFHTNDWNSTNTGAALTTGDGFELLPSGVPRTTVMMSEVDSVTGGVGIKRYPVKGSEEFKGSLKMPASYSGPQRMIAGFYGADTTSSLGSGAYSHLLTFTNNSTYSGTLAWTDNLVCHDCSMTKIESYGVDWKEGALGVFEFGVVGKRELIDGSGANTLSSVNSNCTLPSQPAIRYMIISSAQCTVRIRNAADGALAAGHVYYPNAISLKFARELKRRKTSHNLPYIDEPLVGNWIPVTGTISFPIWDLIQDWTDIVAGTEKKMDIAFVGTTIGGGFTWKYLWEFPSVYIKSDGLPDLNNPDLLELSFPFTAHTANSAPTGMAFTTPRLTITDTTAASHLTNGV